MALDSVVFKDFEIIIWLGTFFTFSWVITMVIVHIIGMVTMVLLYIYPFRCVDLALLILKST